MEKKKKSSKKVPKSERKKVGRPTSVTPETLAKLEQAFSLGCSDLEACIHADIAKSTLYDYQGRHPEFVERKEMLKRKLVLKARTVVANALEKKTKIPPNGIWREKRGTNFRLNKKWLSVI